MGSEIEVVASSASFYSKKIWKIHSFSTSNAPNGSYSCFFYIGFGGCKWEASLYPKGEGEVSNHISLYLRPIGLAKSVDTVVSFADTSQTDPRNTLFICWLYDEFLSFAEGKYKFSEGNSLARGWKKFMSLSELHDPANGYIVNDTCVITIEVTCIMKVEEMVTMVLSKIEDMDNVARELGC